MTYTPDQARSEITQLVRTFKASELTLMDEAEAQIENNFVRPLFEYLNWNTRNAGLAVPDYEFLVQKTQRYGKRPDYILQLDGQHLLVMDAKQVKYDMHDPRWMNQVYAYAYSTQSLSPTRRIDFAVLTDFQEFVVLDCTLYAGDPKAVGNFRVLDWRCDDYVRQFDTLWDLFERNNVRRHARTRGSESPAGLWARYLSPKKVKANRIPPDKAFLAEMDDDRTGWRVILAKDMKKRNPQADGALITAAVQLWIDRLIFVKVLSDREIEEDYLTQLAEIVERDGLAESDTSWFSACRGIFDKLNQFYDGSVFEPRPELEAVTVSNKVVRDVLRELQPENSPYNFSVLPVETLGTIYERFLGRVVRTTDQRVKIEDKPEVRKAGGVYYTPQYIVKYIVRHTLGKLLEHCATPEDVARLKILDPACGSGSFLLGAYQALIDWHIHYYSDKQGLSAKDRSAAYHDSDGRVRLTARLKRQILLNNLYGVDIDAQAVEVTRFSLSLKALEDTRPEELTEERSLFQQTVLPDLSANIQCGNSLIGPDYFSGQMFADPGELKRVNPFNWTEQFAAVMARGGFDAVIGNPPWVSLSGRFGAEIWSPAETDYMSDRFRGNTYMPNLYEYFVAQGLALTRASGYFSMIVPDRLGFNRQYIGLRERILAEGRLLSLVHKVPFPGVTADTLIFVVRKTQAERDHFIDVSEYGKPSVPQLQGDYVQDPAHQFIYFENANVMTLVRSLPCLSKLTPLGDLCHSTSGFGGRSELVQETRTHENQIRTLKGDSIGRYEMRKVYWFDFRPENITGRTTDTAKLGASPKVLLRKTGDRIIATYDQSGVFPEQSLYFLYGYQTPTSPKFLLGILNSSLLTCYYRARSLTNRRSIAQVKKVDLDALPIPVLDFSLPQDRARHERMVVLVDSMLALHEHKAAAKTQAEQELYQRQIEDTDRQIDALVYKLYGLTEDEIKIVEGR